MLTLINLAVLALSTLFFIILLAASLVEREWRASTIAFFSMLGNAGLWTVFYIYTEIKFINIINILALGFLVLIAVISLVKYFPRREARDTSHIIQYDERDNMFSRNNLKNNPEQARQYYENHPEKEEGDRKLQEKPNIGEPGHTFYDPLYSPVFDAAFTYLNRTRQVSEGEKAPGTVETTPGEVTGVIKQLARYYGAADVGVTRIKPYHIYSHAGRHSENWGLPVKLDHTYAVVIMVAMDIDMIKTAPSLPVIMESARHYVESAKIAHIIAEYIRGLGYRARSHTDGNYQVLCAPLAVDAGLGELGRMGLLMHPVHGPCVRLSVVTTELELAIEKPGTAHHIEEFCEICKKCAHNCPSKSIPQEEEPQSRGCRHWSIDQEKCFAFWKNIGTDCAFCIAVCPYTKPDTLIHKLVRFYISRNPINQRIALFFDDLLYGRKKKLPTANPPQPLSRH